MNDRIFCKVISGETPGYKVYEDEEVYVFLDIIQVAKGHTLMIPEQHIVDIFEHNDALTNDVFVYIPKVVQALEETSSEMEGLNILNNNKEMVYQSVFHSHVHLIPRHPEEGDFSIYLDNHQEDYSAEVVQKIVGITAKQVN